MITRLQLIRNIGQFESVNSAATIPLLRLTLIYAENGRGKTTLAAILRSLGSANPLSIMERRRLSAAHPPHVVLECTGGPPPAVFQNGAWSRSLPNIAVFDDIFVDENICSGLAVDPEHRQNLHELILGPQGVRLNVRLQEAIGKIEAQNSVIRKKAEALPAGMRGSLSVDDFCALPSIPDIDEQIQATQRNLAAAQEKEPVRTTTGFPPIGIPTFDVSALDRLLGQGISTLDTTADARVQEHLASIGAKGEAWVAEGMGFISEPGPSDCPFCAQSLANSPIIGHYRAYFGTAYADLKRSVVDAINEINRLHGGDGLAAFERNIRVCVERRQFWSRFCAVPQIEIDTAAVVRAWHAAHDAVLNVLKAKQAAPLDQMSLPPMAKEAIAAFESIRDMIGPLEAALGEANDAIRVVKEQAAAGNVSSLAADLARLNATKTRHGSEASALCSDYETAKQSKALLEAARDLIKEELRQYRETIFPRYQASINEYLRRFNAGFRLDNVVAADTRGGPACNYNVVVNETAIPVIGGQNQAGQPSFRTVLSSGDRNTLALAFFFASLDQDPALADKIIVIDDPITSLDEHRALTTVQEVRRLTDRGAQVIVLSHNKPFLCRIWEFADRANRTSLQLLRDGAGSSIGMWDVTQDCITEHDRRHALLREYTARNTPNNREVARSIRPVIEAFLRVAHPEFFPPGTLLGPFRGLCEQRAGTSQQILDGDGTRELRELVEFANRFHHDTNPAWETEAINDTELLGFVQRTLTFAR